MDDQAQYIKINADEYQKLKASASSLESLQKQNATLKLELYTVQANYQALSTQTEKIIEQARLVIQWIQDHCAGEAYPRWDNSAATTHSRGLILDKTNYALDFLKPPKLDIVGPPILDNLRIVLEETTGVCQAWATQSITAKLAAGKGETILKEVFGSDIEKIELNTGDMLVSCGGPSRGI